MRATRQAAIAGLAGLAELGTVSACTEDWDFSFGGAAGTGGGAQVACGSGVACAAGQVCCVLKDGSGPTCGDSCDAVHATLSCSEPSHCPGAQCCLARSGADVTGASCSASCGAAALELCPSTENTCSNSGTCSPDADVAGLFVCVAP